MTKFTIEDLRDIAYRGSYDDLERELALQLLASMEQAPVYLRPFGDDGETFVSCDGNDERAITLYAAPQLPQPAVDQKDVESLATDLMKRIDKITGERHSVATLSSLRVSIVEACRAAMLQGAEPVQGWIPCSELMPPCFTGVIVAAPWPSAPDGYAMKWATNCPWHPDADENGWLIPGASWKPTHWMPLPAAPQQEVSSKIQEERERVRDEMAMGARLTKHRFKP